MVVGDSFGSLCRVLVALTILVPLTVPGCACAAGIEGLPPPLVDWDKVNSTIGLISILIFIIVIVVIIIIAIMIWKFFRSMGFRKEEVMEVTRTAGKAINLASTPPEEVGYRFGTGLLRSWQDRRSYQRYPPPQAQPPYPPATGYPQYPPGYQAQVPPRAQHAAPQAGYARYDHPPSRHVQQPAYDPYHNSTYGSHERLHGRPHEEPHHRPHLEPHQRPHEEPHHRPHEEPHYHPPAEYDAERYSSPDRSRRRGPP